MPTGSCFASFSMAKIKGEDLVYAESTTDDWWGAEALDLVFYDTLAGRETYRLPIAKRPFLHAGTLSIAVTSATWTPENGERYQSVGIVQLTTGRIDYPGFRGRATVVTQFCCAPPVCVLPTTLP